MQITRYDAIAPFYARAEPFLLAHEAEHNLPLGICSTLLTQPDLYAQPPYLALVEEQGDVVTAAIRTPPFNPVLSLVAGEQRVEERPDEMKARQSAAPLAGLASCAASELAPYGASEPLSPRPMAAGRRLPASALGAVALLVDDLRAVYPDLPGVLGPSEVSRAFAERWQAVTGQPYRPGMRERIYRLTAVRPPQGVPGKARPATDADRPLLEAWLAAFGAETGVDGDLRDPREWVDHALGSSDRDILLWEDVEPVSLACSGSRTPNGSRIGPVYTPPEARGHGYASACTAAVSQLQLNRGRRFCFLFTDLANPTSNHIYQTIGYEPVSDVDVYLLRPAR